MCSQEVCLILTRSYKLKVTQEQAVRYLIFLYEQFCIKNPDIEMLTLTLVNKGEYVKSLWHHLDNFTVVLRNSKNQAVRGHENIPV